jgi:hypothetical protein
MTVPSQYHADWQNRRIGFMLGLYGKEFFRNKTILELGSYNGYIGNYFAENCDSIVTSVEGRQQNVDQIKIHYPMVNAVCADLDTPDWDFGDYDIIINYGLCYHLQNYHQEHLINCLDHCNFMFFETVVFDSFESEIFFNVEDGDDQSLSGVGGTPSTSFIENIFRDYDCDFIKYCDRRLGYKYDWPDGNSKQHSGFYRRLWTVDMTHQHHALMDKEFEGDGGSASSVFRLVSSKIVEPDRRLTQEEWEQLIQYISFSKCKNQSPTFDLWNHIVQKLYDYKESEM